MNRVEIFIRLIVLCFLIYETYEDIRKKSVAVVGIVAFSIVGVVINCLSLNFSINEMLIGVSVGAGVILLGRLMNNGIGAGDGAILFSIGILLGGELCLLIFLSALTMAALTSVVLLIMGKVSMKQRIPFVPYILCGYLFVISISGRI